MGPVWGEDCVAPSSRPGVFLISVRLRGLTRGVPESAPRRFHLCPRARRQNTQGSGRGMALPGFRLKSAA